MSLFLWVALLLTLALYVAGMALCLWRLVRGPASQDRVLALDVLFTFAFLSLTVLAIFYLRAMDFSAALLIALFGFVGSTAMAKFLLRGEVIE